MRVLRVLVLLHPDLVPPDTLEGHDDNEAHRWLMEYDVREALKELGHQIRLLPVENELAPIRQAIEEWEPHIAFNLLRQFHGVGMYDSHVVSYLELLKTAYTGANPRGLLIASDKALAKKILAWHRVPVPAFAVFRKGRVARAPRKLEFPLIVKSVNEHASLGIAQASIVRDEEALRERVEFVHRRVGTDALAERYIEGRELSVAVLGNERLEAFPTWEMTFQRLPEGSAPIATARVKWDLDYQERVGVTIGPAKDLSEAKAREIARVAKRVYRCLDLSGFARIDLRMDPEGRVFVLEANPNCDLCRHENFAESAQHAGVDYLQLIRRIINLGLRYQPAWKEEE